LREAHEKAVRISMGAFTANAVGVGVVRTKYEGMLHRFFKKEFEVWNIRNYLTAIS